MSTTDNRQSSVSQDLVTIFVSYCRSHELTFGNQGWSQRERMRPVLWRDNLDEVAATIRMAIWCRGWLMIDAWMARRKAYF